MQLAGFDLELPRRRVQEMKDLALKRAGLTEREVENQIEARNEVRPFFSVASLMKFIFLGAFWKGLCESRRPS